MKKPNFIICGSSASGTSFLTSGMGGHPDIYLPKKMRPEPHYFYKSWEYEKDFGDYYLKKYFSEVGYQSAIGERSSSYMFGNEVPSRMYKHLPGIKLIFMLRNPIERAYANYRYTVLEGLEPNSFMDALTNEKARIEGQKGLWAEIQPYNYTGRGYYYEQLQNFAEYYDKEKMLIIKSETFGADLQNDFNKVFDFLSVSTNYEVSEPSRFTSLSVIDPELQVRLRKYFDSRFDLVVESIRKEESSFDLLQGKKDEEMYRMMVGNLKGEKIDMTNEARLYLRDLFQEDMKKLSAIVPFDITDWR